MSIGIVGLGYVGLPLAVGFAEAGLDVVGVDVDQAKVAALADGQSHIEDIPAERLGAVLERCTFTTRFVELHEAEAILICVPTPLTRNREPDLGPLLVALERLGSTTPEDRPVAMTVTSRKASAVAQALVRSWKFEFHPTPDLAQVHATASPTRRTTSSAQPHDRVTPAPPCP